MIAPRIATLVLFLGCCPPVRAACPPAPDLLPLPGAGRQVDLAWELDQPWQAGGAIVVYCAPDGSPRAGRLARPPRDAAEEQARRAEHLALASKLNFARKGEAHPLGLPLARPQIELLERFALSDAGAVWLREVADDSLRQFNKGYLEYNQTAWKAGVRTGTLPTLPRLITGRLSEAGQFAGDVSLFKFSGYAGRGAMAHPGAIGLGDQGLRCQFPSSEELVDPHAIISHEFGHTRYGDPTSAGTLLGEARTVERYENPVRIRNGYEPRTVYYQQVNQGTPEPQQGSLLERLLRLEKERGISVADQTAVDRYHCDCPGPLPIILDCQVREGGMVGDLPVRDHDCKLNWRPMEAPAWPGDGQDRNDP